MINQTMILKEDFFIMLKYEKKLGTKSTLFKLSLLEDKNSKLIRNEKNI